MKVYTWENRLKRKKGLQKSLGDELIEIFFMWAFKNLVGPGHPRPSARHWVTVLIQTWFCRKVGLYDLLSSTHGRI